MLSPHRYLALAALVTLSAMVAASAPEELNWQEREFTTADRLRLHGWLYTPPVADKAPLVITLPMRGHTHASYEQFLEAVREYVASDSTGNRIMPYILSFDLRGHGQSTSRGKEELDFRTMSHEEYQKIPVDIAHATAGVVADSTLRIDPKQIVVVGASIGANSAVMLTEHLPGVRKVVMLSPGENYLGLEPAEAVEKYSGRILIYATEEDTRSREGSEYLVKFNRKNCTLKLFSGQEHGTNIINGDSQAMGDLIDWIFSP